jgi:hypothetical protein
VIYRSFQRIILWEMLIEGIVRGSTTRARNVFNLYPVEVGNFLSFVGGGIGWAGMIQTSGLVRQLG